MASNIPSTIVAPLFAFDVQSAGQFQNENRLMLLGHASSAGSMAAGDIAVCTSDIDARNLAGAGSMLESMYLIAAKNAPAQEIWLGAVDPSGTAEIRTITVDDVPAAGGQGIVMINGERVAITIAAGTAEGAVATALAAAINAYYNRFTKQSLPYTATAALAVVTLTARHKGAYATRLDIYVPVTDTGNAFTGNLTMAVGTAGAGAPDISDVIATMGDDTFEMVVCPFNDDANILILEDYLSEVSGNWSYARQLYGAAFTVKDGTSSALTTYSLAKDNWHVTTIPRFSAGGNAQADYLWLAAFVARIAPWFGGGANGDVSRNQTGLIVEGISPPRDRLYWPGYPTRNTFLQSGLSTWSVTRNGDVAIDKIITHQQTTNGAPDTTFRDIQRIGQMTYALRKFRADLAYEHSNKGVSDDNPANLDAITTPKDIRNTLIHTYASMPGVLRGLTRVINYISVEADADNPDRYNMMLPLEYVNPLDILGGLAKIYSQFRQTA